MDPDFGLLRRNIRKGTRDSGCGLLRNGAGQTRRQRKIRRYAETSLDMASKARGDMELSRLDCEYGAYEIVSFGHTWKEVDESNALVAGTPPPEEDPEPYHQTVQESYYKYRPELSIDSHAKQPLAIASVTQILLKPETVQDFEIAVQRIKQFLSNTGDAPAFSARWYELVTGGDRPQFLLIEEHRDWASFHGSTELDALRNLNRASELPQEIVKSFWQAMRSIYSETWHYRSDLSRFVSGK